MNVLHVVPSISAADGGPSAAVFALARAVQSLGVSVTIATTTEERSGALSIAGFPVKVFRRDFEPYKVSRELGRWLKDSVSTFDLVHIHALFSFSSTVACRAARRGQIPYIVRPIGVLNRWGMQNRRPAAKRLSLRWVEGPLLSCVDAMHYTSVAEREEAEDSLPLLHGRPSFVLPLPIQINKTERSSSEFVERFPDIKGKLVVLFLSRIDPKKGIELLLDAFSLVALRNDDAILVIAGGGNASYLAQLQGSATAQKLGSKLRWVGHLDGSMKASALAAAAAFVLPSHSENFGMAAAESLAAGTPTIVSPEVAISADIREFEAGLIVERESEKIATAVLRVLDDEVGRARMRRNALFLVERKYSVATIGNQLSELYERVLRAKAR